jgi:flagella basal body P-ring formation protein FlgA
MLRLASLLLLLALATPATAQATDGGKSAILALRQSATVASDLVRIGDLVENAGPAADIAIFRSPDLGTTGTVSAAAVLDALRAHDLFYVDTRGVSEIEVTRASRTITVESITARIARTFAHRYGLGDARSLSVTFDRDVRAIEVEPSVTEDLQMVRAHYDPRSTRFDVQFALPGSAAVRPESLRYTGSLVEMVETVVPTRPLARGDVIRSSDVVAQRRPKAGAGSDIVAGLDQVIGMAARQPLRPGQPLRRADLMRPQLVQRGEIVTLVYEAPGMRLTMRGQALDFGAEGDAVNVLNVQSKRTIQGTVSGPGRVTITSPIARVAANAAPPSASRRISQ